MNKIMQTAKSLLLGMVLLCSGTAMALEGQTLGLTIGFPTVDTNPFQSNSCSYDPLTEVLTIITQPFFVNFSATNLNIIKSEDGTGFGGFMTYTLNIQPDGTLKSPAGTMVMMGSTSDPVSLATYGGVGMSLLEGDITDFGIVDAGTNDNIDITASITGGDLAALYPANSAIGASGVLLTSDYSFSLAMAGDSGFDTIWTCAGADTTVGSIAGVDETCDLIITKTVDPTEIGPFAPIGNDSDSDTDSDSGMDNDGDGHTDNSDTDSSHDHSGSHHGPSHDTGGSNHSSDSGPNPMDCGCKGKVSELTLQYNGADDTITITRKDGVVLFGPAAVITGQLVNIVGPAGGGGGSAGTLSTEISITSSSGVTKIHTSCSKPIGPGLVVDDWEVIDGSSKKLNLPLCPIPAVPCAGEVVTYTYTVTNNGSALTGVTVNDNLLGQIGGAFDIASLEVVVLMEDVCITETTTNTVTAAGALPSGEACPSNTAEATVEVLLPPDPDDCQPGEGTDSDSGIDGNGNGNSDSSDSDSGDKDCDNDSDVVPPVPMVLEGCSPGYWKKKSHFDSWVNYNPGDKFDFVFGVNAAGNKSLLKTLKTGGGKSKALGRHATSALLNAGSGDVNYLYTAAEVVGIVQDAYNGLISYKAAKNTLRDANKMGCPLN